MTLSRIVRSRPVSYVFAQLARLLEVSLHEQRTREYRRKYDVASSFEFHGRGTRLTGDGTIHIGKEGHVSSDTHIHAYRGTRIDIGDYVRIGANVTFHTVNYVPDQDFLTGEGEVELSTGDITVGDGTWIGNNVFVTEDTDIGSGVIVGANAVVASDVPDDVVVGGVPARVIREL